MMTDRGFILRLAGCMVAGIVLAIALAMALGAPGDHTRFHATTNPIATSQPR